MYAARSDDIQPTYIRELTGCINVQATAHSIAADIGKDNSTQSGGPHFKRQICCGDSAIGFPAAYVYQSVPRIDPHYNSLRTKLEECVADDRWLLDRNRSQNDTVDTDIQRGLHCIDGAHAAAELNLRIELPDYLQNTLHSKAIRMIAFSKCTIQIHNVQPARARLQPTPRGPRGIIAIGSHPSGIAFLQAYNSSSTQVDRRINDEAHKAPRK